MKADHQPDTPSRAEKALAAVVGRRSVSKLVDPAPDDSELSAMIGVACTAPDHGRMHPWRFIVLRDTALTRFGEAFAHAQGMQEPMSSVEDRDRTAAKALRAPAIVVVVARLVDHPKVAEWEQLVAAGCAAQNLCIAATAYGYGTMWRTGWLAEHPHVVAHLGLDSNEQVVGFVYLGTTPENHEAVPRNVDLSCVTWKS